MNDCYEVMQELVKTQVDFDNLADDDPQIAYLIGAWTRICKILGKDFEQYLPVVMGPVLKAAAFKPEVTVLAGLFRYYQFSQYHQAIRNEFLL